MCQNHILVATKVLSQNRSANFSHTTSPPSFTPTLYSPLLGNPKSCDHCVTHAHPLSTMTVWWERLCGRTKATPFQIWLPMPLCCLSDIVSFVVLLRCKYGFRSQAKGWWKWVSDLVLTKQIVAVFSCHY